MRLTPSQLEIARTRPQKTKLDLFIYQPQTVMKAQVNSPSIGRGAMTIPFDNVTQGSHTGIEEGMTVLIGTTSGSGNKGRIRLRSATSGQIVVSENSNIDWRDDLFITVLRYWEVWPVFPRIIQDPANEENVIFYKDYDVLHTNQNNILGTVISMGTHKPILIENGTGTCYYTASGTYNLIGEALTYDWFFEGASATGSTSHTPGLQYYTTPGDYVTRLIVTSSSGAVDKSYRYVSVRNDVGEGSLTPVVKWEMGEVAGSRGEGGYNTEFTLHNPIQNLFDGALIMLKSRDTFGSQEISLGGNAIQGSDVFFCGYIDSGSIEYSFDRSQVSFTVSTIHALMKRASSFSVSVESKASASTWFELADMNIQRAIYHYLRWHSTVLNVTDFEFRGTDYPIQYYDADRGSLFDSIDELLRSALIGTLCADRQGKLWAEVSPQGYQDPTGSFTPVMDITRRDWMGTPAIQERLYDELSYIECGGIAFSGAITGTFTALLSEAPGVPSFHGSVENISGLALQSQTQLNALSGHLWADKNKRYPTAGIDHAIGMRNLDIAPYEVVNLSVDASETVRNEDIDSIFVPATITWRYDHANELLIPTVEYEQVVNGIPGRAINIPEPSDDFAFDFPSFNFPPLPPFAPVLQIVSPMDIDNVQVLVPSRGVYYTNNFTSDFPSWNPMNVGTTGSGIVYFDVSATGKMFAQYQMNSIYYASQPGAQWENIFDAAQVTNPEDGQSIGRRYVWSLGVDRRQSDSILILAGYTTGFGSNTRRLYPWRGTSSSVSLTNNVSIVAANQQPSRLLRTGNGWAFIYVETTFGGLRSGFLPPMGTSVGNIVTLPTTADGLSASMSKEADSTLVGMRSSLSTTEAVSYIPITGTTPTSQQTSIIIYHEPTVALEGGQYLLVGTNPVTPATSGKSLVFSDNFGATWQTIQGVTGTVSSVWHLGEDTFAYSSNGAMYVIDGLTTGTQIYDKTGNLKQLISGTFYVAQIRHY